MKKELQRKLFHLASLLYLVGFLWLRGPNGDNSRMLGILGGWLVLEGVVEGVRLRVPRFNQFLISFFGSIHRPEEAHKISGIFWTAVGCWITIWLFGARISWVSAALFYLSLGDAAAALVGMSLGKTKLGTGPGAKTLEGSLACFLACLVAGFAVGLRGLAPWVGAAAATVFEFLPLPLNDNLWLPVGSALALRLFS